MTPPVNTDLAYLSVAEQIEQFEEGSLTPSDVLEAQLSLTHAVQPTVNAFTETMEDRARDSAAASAERYRAGTARPLEGITVAVKEKQAIAGMKITEGSLAWDGFTPDHNAPMIQRLIDAGAILHARTATPEFSLTTFTHSDMWGVTRNPWNTDFTPGGSSGGAAAAVAAGMTTLATASDIGGSIRCPASFSGLVGFKSPYGRVPGEGAMVLDWYRGDGGLGRSIDDVIRYYNVVAGPDDHDPASVPFPSPIPSHYEGVKGMRIGLVNLDGSYVVDPEIVTHVKATAEILASNGAEVKEVVLPFEKKTLMMAAGIHFAHMDLTMVQRAVGDNVDKLTDYARAMIDEVKPLLDAGYRMFDAAAAEYTLQQQLAAIFADVDALLVPVTAAVGFPAGDSMLDGIDVAGQHIPFSEATFTIPFNINNRHPVLVVPTGHAVNAMPIGVQIVGPRYRDDVVFRVGSALEDLQPWAYTAKHRPAIVPATL